MVARLRLQLLIRVSFLAVCVIGIISTCKVDCVTLICNPGGQRVKIPNILSLDVESEGEQTSILDFFESQRLNTLYTRIQRIDFGYT